MPNFQPFQNLYQHFKGTNQVLFNCFDKVSTNLQALFNTTNSLATSLNWEPVNLVTGYTSASSTTYVPSASVNSEGIVHLCGGIAVASFVNNIVFGNVPSDCIPISSVGFLSIVIAGGVYYSSFISIDNNGKMTIHSSATPGLAAQWSLDGFSYRQR